MIEELFHAGMLAMLVALGACGAASHSSAGFAAPTASQAATASTIHLPLPEPQAPFDTTPISPVESAGASLRD